MNKFNMLLTIGLFSLATLVAFSQSTPLDDYVRMSDPVYGYNLIKTYTQPTYTVYVLNFTSQKWYDETVLDKPIWWHYLCITVPKTLTIDEAAFMLISSGNQENGIPDVTDGNLENLRDLALGTGAITVLLRQIPNQPLVFKTDPSGRAREEDESIAWTWKLFLDNPSDPFILLRMPMTKAAVRAMDATEEFTKQQKLANLKKFMIGGLSKRGWTTWTTAAVDNQRVVAAVPIVMDLLDFNTNMHLHYKSLGGWTFAFADYYDVNITQHMDTPNLYSMQQIIDPYFYLDRYRNTKIMVVSGSNDEFFIPDNTHTYWNDLRSVTAGSAMLKRIPNCDHSLRNHNIALYSAIQTFFLSIFSKTPKPLPSFTWSFNNNPTHGVIKCIVDTTAGPTPSLVKGWSATTLSSTKRDFRAYILDPKNPSQPIANPVLWVATEKDIVKEEMPGKIVYTYSIPKPSSKWIGFFIELSFPSGIGNNYLTVTTETNVIPEYYGYEDCYRESCQGTLV